MSAPGIAAGLPSPLLGSAKLWMKQGQGDHGKNGQINPRLSVKSSSLTLEAQRHLRCPTVLTVYSGLRSELLRQTCFCSQISGLVMEM